MLSFNWTFVQLSRARCRERLPNRNRRVLHLLNAIVAWDWRRRGGAAKPSLFESRSPRFHRLSELQPRQLRRIIWM